MNKLKIAFTIFILAGLSLVTFVQVVAIDEEEQTQIRKKLYSMDDFSGLTAKEVAQYKKIIANHIINLEEKIEKGSRVINWNTVKGTLISGFFSCCAYVFWDSNLKKDYSVGRYDVLVLNDDNKTGKLIRTSRFSSYIKTLSDMDIHNQLLLVCSLFAIPTAYHYFNKAWYVKDRAKSRLLRDQGVLYQLAQLNPTN